MAYPFSEFGFDTGNRSVDELTASLASLAEEWRNLDHDDIALRVTEDSLIASVEERLEAAPSEPERDRLQTALSTYLPHASNEAQAQRIRLLLGNHTNSGPHVR